MDAMTTKEWCIAEGRRRWANDLAARVALLAPAEDFDDDYAPVEALTRIRPDLDPTKSGPQAQAIRGVLCSSCAGWKEWPTSEEFYEAVQATNPTARQRSIVAAIGLGADWVDVVTAHLQAAFTWRQMVRTLHLIGFCPPDRATEINAWRKPRRLNRRPGATWSS